MLPYKYQILIRKVIWFWSLLYLGVGKIHELNWIAIELNRTRNSSAELNNVFFSQYFLNFYSDPINSVLFISVVLFWICQFNDICNSISEGEVCLAVCCKCKAWFLSKWSLERWGMQVFFSFLLSLECVLISAELKQVLLLSAFYSSL